MKIGVIGGGGLGSKFAAYLARHAEMVVLHHRPDYVEQVRQHGLRMTCGDDIRIAQVVATLDPAELNDADMLLLTVKSYDTEAAVQQVAPFLAPDSIVLTLQNGLGSFETLVRHLGEHRAGIAVTTEGATLAGPGEVIDKGKGITYVGSPHARPGGPGSRTFERLGSFVDLVNASGLVAELSDRIEGLLWAKLAMVSGINPLAVILRLSNGDIGRIPEVSTLSREAISEVAAVAARKGIDLAFDPLEAFEQVTERTASMLSGSLLDSLRHRKTEIGFICGAIARAAETEGIPAPVNGTMAKLVTALEATYDRRVEAVPEPQNRASE
jgi:2-dehydropantoate 2-reductase